LLAEALSRAGPEQDVVFGFTGTHSGFSRNSIRTTAGRMFVTGGRLNIIFGDILRPEAADAGDISHYSEPHRAGKRMEPNGRDIVAATGTGIAYYKVFDRPRLDWIMMDVPAIVASYVGPAPMLPETAVKATVTQGGGLSQENRKLREELARMRKESESDPAPAPVQQVQPVMQQSGTAHLNAPATRAVTSPAAAPQAPTNAESVQSRLQLLKDLHDQGLITDQEYDAKRKEIVEQI
jgi:hypothetical protein